MSQLVEILATRLVSMPQFCFRSKPYALSVLAGHPRRLSPVCTMGRSRLPGPRVVVRRSVFIGIDVGMVTSGWPVIRPGSLYLSPQGRFRTLLLVYCLAK